MSTARPAPRGGDELAAAFAAVAEVPIHRFCGLEILEPGDGAARARFVAGPSVLNNAGVVHGGILYALLDAVSYLAVLTRIPADRNAVTVDISVAVMRAVKADQRVELEGRVLKAGASLVFAESRALVEGRVVAVAKVTKSTVAARPAPGAAGGSRVG